MDFASVRAQAVDAVAGDRAQYAEVVKPLRFDSVEPRPFAHLTDDALRQERAACEERSIQLQKRLSELSQYYRGR